jgi:hypothetical protein
MRVGIGRDHAAAVAHLVLGRRRIGREGSARTEQRRGLRRGGDGAVGQGLDAAGGGKRRDGGDQYEPFHG